MTISTFTVVYREIHGLATPVFMLFSDDVVEDERRLGPLVHECFVDQTARGQWFLRLRPLGQERDLFASEPLSRDAVKTMADRLARNGSLYALMLGDVGSRRLVRNLETYGADPLDFEGKLLRIRRLLDGGKFDRACVLVDECREEGAFSGRAAEIYGRSHLAAGQLVKADTAYRLLGEQGRGLVPAQVGLGLVARCRGKDGEALEFFRLALDGYPNHAACLMALVDCRQAPLEERRVAMIRVRRMLGDDEAFEAWAKLHGDESEPLSRESTLEEAAALDLRSPWRAGGQPAPAPRQASRVVKDGAAPSETPSPPLPQGGLVAVRPKLYALTADGVFAMILDEAFKDGQLSDEEQQIIQGAARLLGLTTEQHRQLFSEAESRFRSAGGGGKGELAPAELYRRILFVALEEGRESPDDKERLEGLRRILGLTARESRALRSGVLRRVLEAKATGKSELLEEIRPISPPAPERVDPVHESPSLETAGEGSSPEEDAVPLDGRSIDGRAEIDRVEASLREGRDGREAMDRVEAWLAAYAADSSTRGWMQALSVLKTVKDLLRDHPTKIVQAWAARCHGAIAERAGQEGDASFLDRCLDELETLWSEQPELPDCAAGLGRALAAGIPLFGEEGDFPGLLNRVERLKTLVAKSDGAPPVIDVYVRGLENAVMALGHSGQFPMVEKVLASFENLRRLGPEAQRPPFEGRALIHAAREALIHDRDSLAETWFEKADAVVDEAGDAATATGMIQGYLALLPWYVENAKLSGAQAVAEKLRSLRSLHGENRNLVEHCARGLALAAEILAEFESEERLQGWIDEIDGARLAFPRSRPCVEALASALSAMFATASHRARHDCLVIIVGAWKNLWLEGVHRGVIEPILRAGLEKVESKALDEETALRVGEIRSWFL